MSSVFDLLIVGAGPGGLTAAATAAESGMRVCLIDDNPTPGGQIWRSGVGPSKTSRASIQLQRRIKQSQVELRCGWRAIDAPHATMAAPAFLRVEKDGQFEDIGYSNLILATGARELFLPFPGWTLPGVYGAGGLQAFAKSGLNVSSKRVVIAGTGPLLLAVAAHLRSAGANVVAIVEQVPITRLARFSLSLLLQHPGKLLEGAGYCWKTLGAPYRTGSWIANANGKGHLQSVTVTSGSHSFEFETDMLAIGFHLIPNTELAQLLHCEIEAGFVRVDTLQQTSVKSIYCIGEATGIGGVEKAQIEGRIAALAASGRPEEARILSAARDRQMRFVQSLQAAFTLRPELRNHLCAQIGDNTIVCRCEDVVHGSLKICRSWREAKLHTRCGMGPCQGRICGPATRFLYGWEAPGLRPPLFPVSVATLAGMQASTGQNPSGQP